MSQNQGATMVVAEQQAQLKNQPEKKVSRWLSFGYHSTSRLSAAVCCMFSYTQSACVRHTEPLHVDELADLELYCTCEGGGVCERLK